MRFGLMMLALACDSDTTTKTFNDNPSIVIMSHSAGFEALEGEVISFRAQASDTNDNTEDLLVAWYLGQTLICDWAAPNEGGDTYCDITMGGNDANIIAEVQDPSGAAGRAEVTLVVTPNDAPTAQILSPIANDRFYSDQLISFHAFVADLEDSPEDLLVQWESSIDGELVVASVADSNGDATGAGYLSEGQHSLQLHVTDTMGKSVTESQVLQVGGPNNPPSCEIQSPADETGVSLGESVNFRGVATDPDISPSELSYVWKSDKDGDLGTGTISSDGSIYFSYADLTAATHAISLEVSDEVGELCTDIIFLTVGTAPVVTIDSPQNGELFEVSEGIFFQATVSDSDELPSQLVMEWSSNLDGVFSNQASDSNGSISFSHSPFTAGTHNISVTAADSSGLTTTSTVTVMVNTPPTAPTINLSPAAPDTADNLLVTASGSSDAEGHNVSYSYQWFLNGAISSNSTAAVSSADTSKGEIWTARVIPNDGYHDGQYSELSVIIANTDPVLSGVSISPASPDSSELLTCSYSSSDADGETLTETVTWTNVTSGSLLGTGATVQLSGSTAADGDVIQCAVEVADSDTSVSGSTSVTVVNTAPEFTSAAQITPSSGVTTSTVLSCSGVAIDTDGSLPTLTHQWENLSTGAVLGSGSSLTLAPITTAPNEVIQCTITATDSDGETVDSSASVSVQNSAPAINSLTLLPATGVTSSSTVTCSAGVSDPDAEQLSATIAWSNSSTGASLGSGSSLTLSPGLIQPGETLTCTASVTDGYSATATDSISVGIDNSLPVISAVSISPATPNNDDGLSCVVSSSDPDGQVLSETIVWSNTSTGAVIGAGATLAMSSALGMPGETIECAVTVDDGAGGGASLSSSVSLGNRAPDQPVLAITPNPATSLDTLECVLSSATDPDGQSVTASYSWYVNSIIQPAETAVTYGGVVASGDTVACTVVTSDGSLSSPMGSASITLSNTPPVIDSLVLDPDPLRTDDDVTAIVVASDAEGDVVSLDYEWSVNGAVIQSGVNNSFAASNFSRGNVVSVAVTPSDANSSGSPAMDGLTVANTAPTAPSVSLSPAAPVEGADDLLCTASGSSDVDGDSVSYSFSWTVDGQAFNAAVSSGSSSTVAAINTFAGELWACTVTPNDSIEDGSSVSISVTIDSDWPGTLTLNNCGATSTGGPSQASCDGEYSGTLLSGQVSVSSGLQSWTVAQTGTYAITAFGAEGGASGGEHGNQNYPGGEGATIYGEFALNAGDILVVQIGQEGANSNCGSGGGGGTFVHNGSQLLLASGGGGGGFHCNALGGRNGGDGQSGQTGGAGICHSARPSHHGGSNGQGGSSSSFGSGGSGYNSGGSGSCSMSAYPASGGSPGGGFGGGGCYYGGCCGNSGAGGGYSGGSLGSSDGCSGGGGGSYNVGNNPSNTAGGNTGHGYVTIDKM